MSDFNIGGNILRGINLGDNVRLIDVNDLIFNRQPTTIHGVTVSWALRFETTSNDNYLYDISCNDISVFNSKAVRILNGSNIEIDNLVVNAIQTNSLDDDRDQDSSTTYFDNLIDIENSELVMLSNVNVVEPLANVPTAMSLINSSSVYITNSWLRGWGNSVLEIKETYGKTADNIKFSGGGVEQVGFLESWTPDFYRTVSFLSDNNGTSKNGISNVEINNWEIICPQIPSSLTEYDYMCIFETPNSIFNELQVSYNGVFSNSLSSMLYLTDVDQTNFNNLKLHSNAKTRCIYLIEAYNTSLDNVEICVPNSCVGVSSTSNRLSFGSFDVLSDFQQVIDNSVDQPTYNIINCQ